MTNAASIRRPWSIIVACVLGIGKSLFNLGVLLFHPESSFTALVVLGWWDVLLIGILILAFIGRDYGRNLLLFFVGIWVFIEFVSLVTPGSAIPSENYSLLYWAWILLSLSVVALLFVPASNRWYRRKDTY